jgi:1-phosphofructokinase
VLGAHGKVNRAELSPALGETLGTIAGIAQSARQLMSERGLGAVAVTLGREGAVMVAPAGAWAAAAPEVPVVSSVGSGDAMLAGLMLALERGDAPQDALRHAVAAGSANAMSLGGGRFTREEFESIKECTHVIDIA